MRFAWIEMQYKTYHFWKWSAVCQPGDERSTAHNVCGNLAMLLFLQPFVSYNKDSRRAVVTNCQLMAWVWTLDRYWPSLGRLWLSMDRKDIMSVTRPKNSVFRQGSFLIISIWIKLIGYVNWPPCYGLVSDWDGVKQTNPLLIYMYKAYIYMTLKQIINVSYLVKKTCCCFAVAVGFSARLSVFLTNLALFQIRSSPILKTICLRDTYLWSPHANDNTVSIYNDSFSISLIIGLRSCLFCY